MTIKKHRGIGLLELLLTITIITILLVSATRYYQVTRASQQIQSSVDTIQAVYYAGASYVENVGPFVATADNIPAFVSNGLLPSNFGTSDNPWGGTVTAPSAVGTQLQLTLTNVPLIACKNLSTKITNPNFIDPGATATCGTTDPTTFTITFTDYTQ